jgi:predicted nuclease of predicted toxin-antitoxin system
MKFFVDANLPFKLALNLRDRGFDALHPGSSQAPQLLS